MGYVICRLGAAFKNLLVSEFPVIWGDPAQARIYATKGDAQRIRIRLGCTKTAVLDAKENLIEAPIAGR